MASAQAALDFMRSNLGIGESPPGSNCNALTHRFAIGCCPWCAISVSLAENTAWGDIDQWQMPGVAADYQRGIAWVPGLRQRFIDAGRYDQLPSIGAVNIYAWGPGTPIGDHTGLTEAWVDKAGAARTDALVVDEWDGTVIALEGNHNDDLVRIRRSMAVINGFGHPPYDTQEDDMTPEQDQKLTDLHQFMSDDEKTQIKPAIARIDERVAKLEMGGGGTVDLDALANAVADKLAARLKA
jgi:hypothetical protein